ncbi:DUF3035 domain-containing protein [Roseivivax sp. CAU 1761]
MGWTRIALTIGCAVLVAGCGEQRLRDLRTYRGTPEEFAIVPNKPLATPPAMAALPAPTPGGANRADVTPLQDAVAALGGDPRRMAATGVPASEAALVAAAGRRGIDAGIRGRLASEDAGFRRRSQVFNWRIVRNDEYNRAYRRQSLDGERVLDGVRRPGSNVRTPSAPPPGR